jgi:hypothetical protein
VEFHITGAFEFFEYYIIHSTAGIDKSRRDNGKTAAVLDISRSTKKPFGLLQGV